MKVLWLLGHMFALTHTLPSGGDGGNGAESDGEGKHEIELKGMHLNHDIYAIVGKQCRTEKAYTGHQHNIFI